MNFVDIGVSAGLNALISGSCLALYSFLKLQPLNARVYFTRWFVLDDKKAYQEYEKGGDTMFTFSWREYIHSFDWVFVALRKPERELLEHAGLDMVVYLRTFKLGVKIFSPAMLLCIPVLFPVYYISGFLPTQNLETTLVDQLTIANLEPNSDLFWVPCVLAWLLNIWALWLLRLEYQKVAQMRLDYLSDQKREPSQFTVLVRQVPRDNTRGVAQQTAQFFSVVHKDHYLMTTPVFDAVKLSKLEKDRNWVADKITALKIRMERNPEWDPRHKTRCCGLTGPKVDSLELLEGQLEGLNRRILEERERVLTSKECIMPASFVSFRSRWGAAVAAQTLQSKDDTKWITTWAPEPGDVAWHALPIPYLSLTWRKFGASGLISLLVILYVIPISIVQGLVSLPGLSKLFPWLTDVIYLPFVSSFLISFLPGLVLMGFMLLLPPVVRFISSLEGYVAKSEIERAAAGKLTFFYVISLFLCNVMVGTAWSEMATYILHPAKIPAAIGAAIAGSSGFFICYTMLNGWTGVAAEVTRLIPLVLFLVRNKLLSRTDADRVKAMKSHGPNYTVLLPFSEFYFLLCFMFWVLAPLYLPFGLLTFLFAYVVYRNQFIHVFTKKYDLAGAYWPHFHVRVLACMILSQIALLSVMVLATAYGPALILLPLPLATFLYDQTFISGPFKPTFQTYALEEAMRKDTIDAVTSPGDNPRDFLAHQYLHPSLKAAYNVGGGSPEGKGAEMLKAELSSLASEAKEGDAKAGAPLVPVRRHPRSRNPSPMPVESIAWLQSKTTQEVNLRIETVQHEKVVLRH